MQRQDGFPDEQVQTAAYARAAELCGGRPLVIRTLDIGGGKNAGTAGASGSSAQKITIDSEDTTLAEAVSA